ncbi:LysM peptidoglycan-binding domain-containing protein [Candidatus Saccharibacteria bacterium]|nr:LysM peptidoglycan-binding domain-containing protein [Candidatus Saccharibacteria bacterium]
MYKPVILTAAVVAVVFGALVPSAHAQELQTSKEIAFVDNVLLAKADEPKQADTEKATEKSAEPEAAKPTPVMVTVQSGDSLTKIATAHNTTWVRLYDANTSIADPNVINPGDQIRIPEADEQLASRPLPQAAPVAVKTSTSTTKKASTRRTTATTASYPVSSNAAKAFIYARESGNNPNATNPNGCYGLGQDCNGRVRALCGADYACQDAYFTNYAMSRYGSWEAAYAFWLSHHWW